MPRVSRVQWYIELAQATAKRSTCCRLNVGAVVVIDRNPVAFGYNGRSAGQPHCEGNKCPGSHGCHETIHAEMNAINRVPPELVSHVFDLYVTDSPCADCCQSLMTTNVKRVFFANPYRITDHLALLNDIGVAVFRVTPAGYIMNWFSGKLVEYS